MEGIEVAVGHSYAETTWHDGDVATCDRPRRCDDRPGRPIVLIR